MNKDNVFYHRAYKKIIINDKYIFLKFLFLILPISIAILFLYPDITFLMNWFARSVLLSSFPSIDIKIIEEPYMFSKVYILDLPGKYPSPLLSFCLFLFSLVSIFFIPKTKISGPIVAWIIFASFINLLSSIYFILMPFIFPYDIKNFSELYVKTEVSIWLFVPIIMGMTLMLLTSNILPKFFIVAITVLYSLIFSILRYTVFLYVLKKFSYIFMPLLFFFFGPLMDFVYIVGAYSLYASIINKQKITEQ